eukprot:s690_g16.t2
MLIPASKTEVGFGSSSPRFGKAKPATPGPGAYDIIRLFDRRKAVPKQKAVHLPAFFQDPLKVAVKLPPLEHVIIADEALSEHDYEATLLQIMSAAGPCSSVVTTPRTKTIRWHTKMPTWPNGQGDLDHVLSFGAVFLGDSPACDVRPLQGSTNFVCLFCAATSGIGDIEWWNNLWTMLFTPTKRWSSNTRSLKSRLCIHCIPPHPQFDIYRTSCDSKQANFARKLCNRAAARVA